MLHMAMKCLVVAILCLAASFLGRSSEIMDGLGKALFGVFFIAFLILQLFGEKRA
jgi:hypothetical protein